MKFAIYVLQMINLLNLSNIQFQLLFVQLTHQVMEFWFLFNKTCIIYNYSNCQKELNVK